MKKLYMGMAGFALLALVGCGETVQPGMTGIKIKAFGSGAGVQAQPLPTGYHFLGMGEDIIQFPTVQRTYSYTKEVNADGAENEEVHFSDNNALPMTADVQLNVRIDATKAPSLYQTWRLSFNQLLEGPIRNDVRTAIAAQSELVSIEYLYKGGRQEMIHKALLPVQKKWAPFGVEISQLDWIGPIRYPDVILESIQRTTKAEADTRAALAQVEVAKAEAQSVIEAARGQAESNRLIAESVKANPGVAQLKAIEKWDGTMPTYWGAGAMPFLDLK